MTLKYRTFVYFCFFCFVASLFSCENRHANYIQSYYYNEKYRYLLNKKEYEKALAAELSSKENLQNHFALDSNLGIVFNLLGKNDEAEKSFNEALRSDQKNLSQETEEKQEHSSQELFIVYFNRGVFFQSQNRIDEALDSYQKALDLNPTSIETKTNIELMIQKKQDDQKKQDQSQDKQKQDEKNKQKQDQSQSSPKDNKGDDKKDQKDSKDKDKKNDKSDDNKDNKDKEKENPKDESKKQAQQSPKYQPRPFKGDQLSEGDVKKILGELSQQDKKIRAQFDKKEKQESGTNGKNEKDW